MLYFMPILVGIAVFLAYPSLLLAVPLAAFTWYYLSRRGEEVDKNDIAIIQGKHAMRILSVKMLVLNGPVDDAVQDVHLVAHPDEIVNSVIRSDLRDAASSTADGWEPYARMIKNVYRDPVDLHHRMETLIIQMSAQPDQIGEQAQLRLLQIGKMWGIGPANLRDLLAANRATPIDAIK